ncbi:hypothetical protein BT96DRAFT_781815, partial [Gymnopus androsaceus JB14]
KRKTEVQFPPPPTAHNVMHDIISGYCNETDPKNFEEAGCCVCGMLRKTLEL